ncbi:MAG TPA: TPM domain-containing protein [Thermoanaerobaculaceae bacterium]|nr:TPM domain-containing protein [Thermoanaerobaculaceae bacterium]
MSWRLAAVVVWLSAGAAAALDVPPVPTRYLTDLAGVIRPGQADGIEQRLAAIETASGHQVLAVIFPSLEGEPLEDFTIRCAQSWKVGRKGIDDGVIFFAFIRDRRMRLEVGYGLESKVPDAIARRILDNAVRPAFAAGDYGGGVTAMAESLQRVFAGEPLPQRRPHRGSPDATLLIVAIAAVVLLRVLFARGRTFGGIGRGGYWGGMGGLGGFGGSGGGWSGGGFSSGGGSFGGGGSSGSW